MAPTHRGPFCWRQQNALRAQGVANVGRTMWEMGEREGLPFWGGCSLLFLFILINDLYIQCCGATLCCASGAVLLITRL